MQLTELSVPVAKQACISASSRRHPAWTVQEQEGACSIRRGSAVDHLIGHDDIGVIDVGAEYRLPHRIKIVPHMLVMIDDLHSNTASPPPPCKRKAFLMIFPVCTSRDCWHL